MHIFEGVYILTNLLYVFTIYKLLQTFFNEEQCNLKVKRIALCVYFISTAISIFFVDELFITLAVNFVFLFLISLCYKSSMLKKIVFTVLIYASLAIIEYLVFICMGYFNLSIEHITHSDNINGLILDKTIMMVLSYIIYRYNTSLKNKYSTATTYYFTFFIVLVSSLFLFVSSINKPDITLSSFIINGAVFIIINATVVIIDDKIFRNAIIENEKNKLKEQNLAYENEVNILNQSNNTVKHLRHDMKNHLIMLNEMYKNNKTEEINEYIDKALNTLDETSYSNTNNFAFDSIINFKLEEIKNTDVKLDLEVFVPEKISISSYDITVILGNLLDNAIDATLKSEEKNLKIKIKSKYKNLIIIIANSYNGEIKIDKVGNFITTKLDKNEHGLGLSIITDTAYKYGGDVITDFKNKTFQISVIIPYED